MKKILFFAIIALFSTSLFAQVQNVNPDPNGAPWIIGGWKSPTDAELAAITILKIDSRYKSKDLPSSLDNSTLQYFRPVFSQTDGCCAQASGIAYNFTYEINRERGTSANISDNQYPTHYTYNFLNNGSGANGSWYGDGWNIIKANGCPNVTTYGGIAQDATYWMSGYSDYKSGMENKIVEIFNIDVSTAEGLETMKYWMFNHGDGAANGGIVNFAAGISIDDYNITYDNIITKWGYSVNHAMTFVGWDDNISYDFNNDGSITNNIDITGDGIVDMRDWEQGAMIMVNSWGEYWGNSGKAYVPYRLLALPVSEGGIGASNMVSSINVRATYEPTATMKVEMQHNGRNLIKIIAGVSTNLSATEPDYTLTFPLFNYQGGDFDMRGTSSSPIDFSLDITPLLSYINSDEEAKFFLQVVENDPYDMKSGTIQSFSVEDTSGNEYVSSQTNVTIIDNDVTTLSTAGAFTFDAPEISNTDLPVGETDNYYSEQLTAIGGEAPYSWNVKIDVAETNISETYPNITLNELIPDNYDDGYATQELDFAFPFYGGTFETVYIRTDGSIVFEPGFDYLRNEDAIKLNKVISVFASDLMIYPEDGDGIYYEGNSEYATFRWKASLYGQPEINVDVAVTLYPNGNIKFFYNSNISQGLSWASGISNGDGMNSLITSNSGAYDASDNQLLLQADEFPKGMSIDKEGNFTGTPTEIGSWNINFVVTDFNNISKLKLLEYNVLNLGVDEINSSNFNIYPNPTSDILNIEQNTVNEMSISIVDLSGKEVFYENKINKKTTNIDVSQLNSGIYFIILNSVDNIETKKIIIK